MENMNYKMCTYKIQNTKVQDLRIPPLDTLVLPLISNFLLWMVSALETDVISRHLPKFPPDAYFPPPPKSAKCKIQISCKIQNLDFVIPYRVLGF